MKTARVVCIVSFLAAVAGCQIDATKRPQAALLVVGGLLDSPIGPDKGQLSPTAFGTLLSTYHRTEVGKSLTLSDRAYAEAAALSGLTKPLDKQTSRWRNSDNDHAGAFIPINNYQSDDGLLCRDYLQSITIDGQTQDANGTACFAHDGYWRIAELPIVRRRNR